MRGVIEVIFPLVERKNRFEMIEFVIKDSYGEPIKFWVTNKMIDRMSEFVEGDDVHVNFAVRGRKWMKGNEIIYIHSLQAVGIHKIA